MPAECGAELFELHSYVAVKLWGVLMRGAITSDARALLLGSNGLGDRIDRFAMCSRVGWMGSTK
jgi:hypothetical protein